MVFTDKLLDIQTNIQDDKISQDETKVKKIYHQLAISYYNLAVS